MFGCARYSSDYLLGVMETIPPMAPNTAAPDESVAVEDEGSVWSFGPIGNGDIGISVKNTGTRPLLIKWDEMSLVDDRGVPHRVVHEGVLLVDKGRSLVPTAVPPGTTHSDRLVPSDWVKWKKRGWVAKGQFFSLRVGRTSTSLEKLRTRSEALIGRSFKILTAFEIDGKKYGRTYTLEVREIQLRSPSGEAVE